MERQEKDLGSRELEAWREAAEVPDFAVAALQARVLAQGSEPRARLPWGEWAVPVAGLAVLGLVLATRASVPAPVDRSVPKAPMVVVPVEATPAPGDAPEAPPPVPLVSRRV